MKKFVLILAIALAAMFAPIHEQAQTTMISTGNSLSNDTVTNTASKILAVKFTGFRETITATINITKISGTLAGTLVPVGSNDGTNFYDISQASLDTFTVANSASQGKAYSFRRGFQWYGVKWTGSGTMSGSFTGSAIARRPTD